MSQQYPQQTPTNYAPPSYPQQGYPQAPPQHGYPQAPPQGYPPPQPEQFFTQQQPAAAKKKGSWLGRILFGLGGLVLGFGLGTATASGDGATTTTAGSSAAGAKSVAAKQDSGAVTVVKNPKTFGDAFDKNQVAAEKQWKGKRIQLTATVANVNEGQITLGGITTDEYSLTQLVCNLSVPDQALTVENGKPVTVVGTVGGQMVGLIDLKDCSVKK